MDVLPSYFDLVVVGTGVTESIVSAAAARQGHSVLHIDPRDYYGGKWATLSWNDWDSGSFAQTPPALITGQDGNQIGFFKRLASSGEVDAEDLTWKNDIRDLESLWYNGNSSVKAEVQCLSRRFNIDILPKVCWLFDLGPRIFILNQFRNLFVFYLKVLMAREEVIELLIQSNVSRYLEFKCINRLMTCLLPPQQNLIEPIPLSRSDIFTTNTISLVEKRRLMKFLEFVLNSETEQEHGTEGVGLSKGTFTELAEKHQLSGKVSHLLQAAMRTMDDSLKLSEDDECAAFNLRFTENCRLFLQSINRYGNQTPFLWTLYGISQY